MRKPETSQGRAPCRRDRMDPAAGAAVAVGVVVGDDVVVVVGGGGGGGGGIGVVAEVAGVGVVASGPERSLAGMSQTWGWVSGRKSCSDKVDLGRAGRTGRQRRRGTLQSGLREHAGPGG